MLRLIPNNLMKLKLLIINLILLIVVGCNSDNPQKTVEPTQLIAEPKRTTSESAVPPNQFLTPSAAAIPTGSSTAAEVIDQYCPMGQKALAVVAVRTDQIYPDYLPGLFLYQNGKQELFKIVPDLTTNPPISWSPDGQQIIFSATGINKEIDTRIYLYDPMNNKIALMDPNKTNDHGYEFVSFSPNQKYISYSLTYGQDLDIYYMDKNGNNVIKLINGINAIWLDENTIMFIGFQSLDTEAKCGYLYTINIHSHEIKDYMKDKYVCSFSISPDRKRIVRITGSEFRNIYGIDVVDIDNQKQTELFPGFHPTSVTWSSDGLYLLSTEDCNLYQLLLDGSNYRKIDLPTNYCYTFAAMQP